MPPQMLGLKMLRAHLAEVRKYESAAAANKTPPPPPPSSKDVEEWAHSVPATVSTSWAEEKHKPPLVPAYVDFDCRDSDPSGYNLFVSGTWKPFGSGAGLAQPCLLHRLHYRFVKDGRVVLARVGAGYTPLLKVGTGKDSVFWRLCPRNPLFTKAIGDLVAELWGLEEDEREDQKKKKSEESEQQRQQQQQQQKATKDEKEKKAPQSPAPTVAAIVRSYKSVMTGQPLPASQRPARKPLVGKRVYAGPV